MSTERTFTRSEVIELMWKARAPFVDADRWSDGFRATQIPRHRKMIERELDEWVAKHER